MDQDRKSTVQTIASPAGAFERDETPDFHRLRSLVRFISLDPCSFIRRNCPSRYNLIRESFNLSMFHNHGVSRLLDWRSVTELQREHYTFPLAAECTWVLTARFLAPAFTHPQWSSKTMRGLPGGGYSWPIFGNPRIFYDRRINIPFESARSGL